jgi:hypothetical protein
MSRNVPTPPLDTADLKALRDIRERRFSIRSELTYEERRVFDKLYEVIDGWLAHFGGRQ